MYRDVAAIEALFAQPFNDLMYQAQTVHRRHFDPNAVQLSTLLSIKTGGCSEDCGYCSQSARFHTGLEAQPLMALDEVIEAAKAAKAKGTTRFCMGARLARTEGQRPGAGDGDDPGGQRRSASKPAPRSGSSRTAKRRRSPPPASTTTTTTSIPRARTTTMSCTRIPTMTD